MTVTYSGEVTTSTTFGIFLKLLLRWKGSIYKMIWADLVVYLTIYYSLNILYLYGLDETRRKHFVGIVTYFSQYGNAIPLSFVLGFFVNVVYNRWWNQYLTLPYPDNIAMLVATSIPGKEERPRLMRRAIIRYVCLAFTLTLTMMSPKVKKRFPTLHHFVQAGLLNHDEKKLMDALAKDYPSYSAKYWLPLAWAINVATRAKDEGFLKSEFEHKDILEQICEFRHKCKRLRDYDWICIPLVYTQVVTLAVYLYFLFTVIGSQFVEEQIEGGKILFRFPLVTCMQFFFYMGWLKVAESLINPFGEDDDDFEVVWMIDRHLQVGYLLVDKIHNTHPTLKKDQHWDQVAPCQLPFTVASQRFMSEHPVESTCNISVIKSEQDLIISDDMKHLEKSSAEHAPGQNLVKRLFSKDKSGSIHHLKRVSVHPDEDDTDDDLMEIAGQKNAEIARNDQLLKPNIHKI
ncbi:bestrophin-3-like [Euwallacea similis]|uniref:bestrophin-3-like n=1 Tax=Euwallacea similis TaxID=1736056 RepID=UPI00344D6A50